MKPFIIAEMSANHNGDFSRAVEIVHAAAKAGASAVKLQTWTPGTMAHPNAEWKGQNLRSLYGKAWTPWAWHENLFGLCKELGIIGFSTPFDLASLAFLEVLDCPIYKIASFEIVDLELIEAAAKTGKPLIISTGMATRSEITAAHLAAMRGGCTDLTLLKCTSAYPARAEDAHLATMKAYREGFGVKAGVSDHTKGIAVAVAAAALGADVIEKHFTINRDGGLDSEFSIEPDEMKMMVEMCGEAALSVGCVNWGGFGEDREQKKLRRSLYFSKDLPEGHIITREDIIAMRPADGLPPSELWVILGRTTAKPVSSNEPVQWESLK
ncbi:MAG: pseudaminic acid synthase [Bellilinea sp.]